MISLCVKTPVERGEAVRLRLKALSLLDSLRKIVKDGDYLYIPVKNNLEQSILKVEGLEDLELVDYDLPERAVRIRCYRELLADKLTTEELNNLPRAFDIIGHIAVIKLPDELRLHATEIGDAILSGNKNLRTVYHNAGVQDTYRVMDLELISGMDDPITVHTEFGIRLELDLKKVYFSPRLATERHRIAMLVTEGEVVADMFAGVGPFSIMMAKLAKPDKIYSMDINPDAIFYLKRNLQLNSVTNVKAREGDARDILSNLAGKVTFNRVVMNLPHSSYEFLQDALTIVTDGGMIHYYEILDNSKIGERADEILTLGSAYGKKMEIVDTHVIHTYSPVDSLAVFDIRLLGSR